MASGQPPFFYHILMSPSSPHLPLPLKFVKKHLRNKILKKPILKSANGGYLWKLKMKKIDDHTFCFVDGWCKVVKDVGLLFGEFLLFKYVGSSVFLMHVYSVNGCEKILVPRITNFKVVDEVSVFEDDEEVVFDDDAEVEDEVEDDDEDDDVEYDVEEDDEDVVEEDEEEDDDDDEVELGDDDDDEDDGEDEDDVDVDGDDGDPFFVITSSKRNKNKLRFPPDLVAMAKIKTKETITLKNDDGYEKVMPVRSYKQNKSTRYYVAEGWKEFQRSNDISEGDECVLKFITSEDKLCLAKVTKKKPRATEVDNNDLDDDDGMDEGEAEDAKEDDSNVDGDDIFDDDVDDEGKGENAKLVNDDEDDEDEDDDRDVDGNDGDPSFILTCSAKYQYHLVQVKPPHLYIDESTGDASSNNHNNLPHPFSADFVALAGINTKKTITLKNLDGYEKKLRVRSCSRRSRIVQSCTKRSRRNRLKGYFLSAGWKEFQRNSNISEGDQFVFKFITSEDKFCVAKITKNITQARPLPRAVKPVIEVDDGMDDQDVDDNDDMDDDDGMDDDDDMDDDDGIDEEGEAEDATEDDSNVDGDDIFDYDVDDEGKGENAKLVNENEDDEDDDCDVDGDDGDPSFISTISDKNQHGLRFSADFAALAGINTKKTITLKNLDGYEKELHVRSYVKSQRGNQWKCYYLSAGWKEFQRNSNISKGDKFVFKFITSEDKFCLAKITKEKTRARPLPPATEAPVTQVNDGMDDQDVDDNDDMDADVKRDDGDPSFILICSEKNQYKLHFSADFVKVAGIDTRETITLKNLDGYEKELHVRSQSVQSHRRNQSKIYYLAAGWKEFQQNSNISKRDKFVFKFIKSEDRFCVAKITKKKTPARPLPPAAEAPVTEVDNGMDNDDGMDEEGEAEDAKEDDFNVDGDDMFCDDVDDEGKGENAKHVNDDEDDEDDDRDVDGDDGDSSFKDMDDNDVIDANEDVELFDDGNPSFVATISPTYNHVLWMPADFARLARLDTKKTLTLKSLDGYEKEMPLRVEQREWTRYYVGSGWKDILQSTSISEGDRCVFKFIASEDKLCLAKIIKKKTQARPQLPVAEAQEKEFNDEVVEDDKDKDDNEDIEPVDGADPFFVVDITTSHKFMLRLPPDFVELAGIDGKNTIIIKCRDGNEIEMVLRPVKQGQSTRYCLSMGWSTFRRSNNISEGDKVVFKYITTEDKMSLAKITKKIAPPAEVDVNDLKVDDGMDGKDVVVDDNKEEDENVEPVDDGMDGKDVVVDDNKDEDENVEPVDDGTNGKDVVVDDNKDKDENVEPVDDGMDGRDVVVDDNKDEDENVEPVDDGMDGKDVVVDDNKDEDENVEPVDDGTNGKDVVVDDNKDKDENVEPVDDGMDGRDVVVDDNKEEDENVEPVDDGMDGKDVVVDDNKDEDENVEPVKDVVVDDNKDKDENVEPVDDGMDGRDVVVDDNKEEDENVEPVDGMDGKDVVVDDNKDEDENVEPVDDGMDGKDVVVDDNKDEDENVELVDDGMDVDAYDNKDEDKDVKFVVTITPSHKSKLVRADGKDVVVDDNKDEDENVEPVKDVVVDDNKDKDENVEPVDDGMDGRDVVVDDNKEEDENVEPVDGMDGKDVVVDDNKDEDENVEPVDDGMDGKDVVVDDNKDEDENVELVDDGMDVDAYDNKDEDKDVKFVVTITPSHKSKLRLPIDFVASAGIESKENITMKSLDGNETQMSMRTDKLRHRHRSKQYHLSVGWPAFKRGNNISEGDECVFMYATSEDKMCLAKITKKENVDVDDNTDEDEYVELVDGVDDKDVNEDAELADDEDPFFRVTITPSHKSMLRLPLDFVGLAGLNTKKNIIIKSLDGNESQMAVRSDQRFNSAQYHLAMGWVAFKQQNNLSLGDECVFKYITSEDKLCLAKVTKTSATEADADPIFVVTITPSHRSSLWLPIDFAGLAGIDTKKNIIVKSLDGNETQMGLRACPFKKKQRCCFSIGWWDFKRSNNISEGDECVFKYITSEDKMCLAKVTKEKTRTSLPSPSEVVKRKRGRLPPGTKIKMTAAESVKMRSRQPPSVKITVAEAVKRKRGMPLPSSPQVTKDVKRKKGSRKE